VTPRRPMVRATMASGNAQPLPAVRERDAGTIAVHLRDVHKSFGSVEAVRGVDLTIRPGEILAFLGLNGAGKTSTIDLILGLSQPTSGQVATWPGSSIRSRLKRPLTSIGAAFPARIADIAGWILGCVHSVHVLQRDCALDCDNRRKMRHIRFRWDPEGDLGGFSGSGQPASVPQNVRQVHGLYTLRVY
jgi:energy-coupling factor transporter ATP-binding protein EcfA2